MFHSPWFLLLLLLLPWVAWRLFRPRRLSAVAFSSVSFAQSLPPTLRQRFLWLPNGLLLLSLTMLILGLARPREGRQQSVVDSQGIAIQLVVDISGSMQAMDFQIDGQHVDRLTAIKSVAGRFVSGGSGLAGRFNDLVGLVTFAGFADGITPPTLDHAFLVANLNSVQIVNERNEDGTAIGDAIALAVEKMNSLDERRQEKIESKVIILLTDGENTAGQLKPLEGAEIAQKLGIKIYAIGVGTQGLAPFPVIDPFTGRRVVRQMQVQIDEVTLTKVAEATGGKYFRATDTDSLTKIYQEIDQLEKSEVKSNHFVDYLELAVQPFPWRGWRFLPLLTMVFACLLVRTALRQTWLREFN